eukprot:2773803-Rhodomonas_salina.2
MSSCHHVIMLSRRHAITNTSRAGRTSKISQYQNWTLGAEHETCQQRSGKANDRAIARAGAQVRANTSKHGRAQESDARR